MYEQISEDTLKELFKIWKVKDRDSLYLKSTNIYIISYKIYKLSYDAKKILKFLLNNNNKDLSSIDIAYSLKYTQKQIPDFFDCIEELKKTGLLYVKMKRRKLNSSEDTLFFLDDVESIIKKLLVDNSSFNIDFDFKYSTSIYKKYLKDILFLYENGCILDIEKIKLEDSDLLKLCEGNIFCFYFNEKNFNPYVSICNNSVIKQIEKSLETNLKSSTFIYNHLNILNDIEKLIYEADIKNINVDDININFISKNLSITLLLDICTKINLISIDSKGNIVLDNYKIKDYIKLSLEEKKKLIFDSVYKGYDKYFKKILDILENSDSIDKTQLFLILKDFINIELFNKVLSIMYLFGVVEVAFYENTIIAIRSLNHKLDNKKCFINGNFEITLINHNLFSNEFIYMCNLYCHIDAQENVYTYKITEDSIHSAKTIISDDTSHYSFNSFLNILKTMLEDIPRNVETTIKRWYDRGVISTIYQDIILITFKDSAKFEEIIIDANKKGIKIIKLNDEYGIIHSSSTSKRALVKFLRQRKVIVSF